LRPQGVGKTTLLREIARVLADDFSQRVVIVDTSNEIGGHGSVPHPGIGKSRRTAPDKVKAVQNHNPTIVIVDEIGTPKKVKGGKINFTTRSCFDWYSSWNITFFRFKEP